MQMRAKYQGICRKCSKAIKIGDLINWEKGNGAIHVDCDGLKSEPQSNVEKVEKSGTYPLYVVYQHTDPRICGDNYSEVYDQVYMIDTLDNCLKYYQQTKRNQRFCGSGIPVTSYTYPDQIKQGQTLTIGQKHVIHSAKNSSHLSADEIYELEHC